MLNEKGLEAARRSLAAFVPYADGPSLIETLINSYLSAASPEAPEDVAGLVERLGEESHRLSYQSIEYGSADSGIASNLADEAAAALTRIAAERDEALEKLDEAQRQPWPEWANEIRECLEGYGVDPGDEWNVAEQFEEWLAGCVENETRRAETAEAEATRLRGELARVEAASPFKIGDRVTKISGSSWTGIVCGTYSTKLTPVGYAVESENEPGSVQIYPAAAIRALEPKQ